MSLKRRAKHWIHIYIEGCKMVVPTSMYSYFLFCCLLFPILIFMLQNAYMYQQESNKSNGLTIESQAITDVQNKQELVVINLEVRSGRQYVYVSINGIKIYEINEKNDSSRGLYVIILNQQTGALMVSEVFDFYGGDSNDDFSRLLNSVHHSRIAIFFIKEEASTGFTKLGRSIIKGFGCHLVHDIAFRDNWACITRPRGGLVTEGIVKKSHGSEWANPVKIRTSIKLERALDDDDQCDYGDSKEGNIRKLFCQKYEGYWDACNCNVQLIKEPPKLINNTLAHAPVVIMASNRPRYLFRMLHKLLSVPGADRKMMTVFIDGIYNETRAVAELFGLRVISNEIECTKVCRIQQHYKKSLTRVFDDFPRADVAIILEEDLEVSDDIFDYFSQTYPLFEKDSSIYCISAWNDQGYLHSVKDPSLLYRVETMPGLGWLLRKSLYKNELESKWPGNRSNLHWDVWMRRDENRKGRECIIPDISRTYHFGAKGVNVNRKSQIRFFKFRALNKESSHKFDVNKMTKDNYEKELEKLISNAEILNYTRTSCRNADDIIPNTKDKIYVIFIKMEKKGKEKSWLRLAKCFKLWELEMRDFHNGLIRFWIKENHIIVIGSPESKYAHYKPKDIIPVEIKKN